MIIKAWRRKTREPIDLDLLGTKGYNNDQIKIIYLCDRCKQEKQTSYGALKRYNRLKKQKCRSCFQRIDPDIKRKRKNIREKKWKENNPERIEIIQKRWKENNPDYDEKWREDNPEKIKRYQIRNSRKMRSTFKGTLNNRMGVAIYYALRDNKDGKHWEDLVDFTLDDLIKHLESLFISGMTWENRDLWHIDHIKPKSSFNYKTVEDPEFKKCWSLDNLQPLWAEDNMKKHNKLDWGRRRKMQKRNREYFYYYRNDVHAPIITVCLISDNGNTARGLSICSPKDNICKKEGKKWARHYAKKAFGTKKSSEPVTKMTTRRIILTAKDPKGNYVSHSKDAYILKMKSVFNPKLTDFEKKLIGKKIGEKNG